MTQPLLYALDLSPFALYVLSWSLFRRERRGLSATRQRVFTCALLGVGTAIVLIVAIVVHGLLIARGAVPQDDVLRRWAYPFIAAVVLTLLSSGLAFAGRGWSRILLSTCAIVVAFLGYEFGLGLSP